MLAGKLLMRAFVAALACMTLPPALVASSAHDQESESLVKKLSELTERKGYKDVSLREWMCEAFDWSKSDCSTQLTFHAPYTELDGSVHVIDSVRIPGRPLRVVFVVHDRRSGYAFWTDPDGSLRGCLRLKLVDQWGEWEGAKRSCEEAEVKNTFSSEMTYWRTRQVALEKAADRRD